MLKTCVLVIFVFVFYNLFLMNLTESSLTVTNLTLCKGPKRKDCSINEAYIRNDTILFYDMQIIRDVIPDKLKMTLYFNGKLLIRFQLKKPCNHHFLKPLIRLSMNMTQDCEFKKGNYSFNYNVEDLLRHGGLYLKGNMSSRVLFYSDDCNFACTIIETENK